jgi:hypothetical protein
VELYLHSSIRIHSVKLNKAQGYLKITLCHMQLLLTHYKHLCARCGSNTLCYAMLVNSSYEMFTWPCPNKFVTKLQPSSEIKEHNRDYII